MGTIFSKDLTYGFDQYPICLAKDLLIPHINGKHSGQCDMYDWYTHEYDGYITGYRNERTACYLNVIRLPVLTGMIIIF